MTQTSPTKPFFRWAGGKQALRKTISAKLLTSPHNGRYIEPFFGAGSIFLHNNFTNSVIGDINPELVTAVTCVRDNPIELMAALDSFKDMTDKKGYLDIRALDRVSGFKDSDPIQRGARFLFLQKVGFNGLWRVNKQEQNNVSYGGKVVSNLYDKDLILRASSKFQNTTIRNESCFNLIKEAGKGDRLYLDPPYIPINNSNFNYSIDGFKKEDQLHISKLLNEIDKKGAHFLLSNSYCEETLEVYKDFKIEEIEVRRSISRNSGGRKVIKEVLISNY